MRILAFVLSLLVTAAGAAPISPLPDTPNLLLERPVLGETNYVDRINQNWNTLDAAVCDKRVGCTVTGDLTVTGTINGSVPGASGGAAFIQENLISQITGVNTQFFLSTSPAPGSLLLLVRDGLTLKTGVDFSITANTITTVSPPSLLTSSFFFWYSTSTSGTGGGGGSPIATTDLTDVGGAVNTANGLVKLSPVGKYPALDGSQITNLPSSPSTVISSAPILGIGTLADPVRVDQASVTLQGNVFNQANRLAKLDSSANLALSNANFTSSWSAPHASPVLQLTDNNTGDAVQIINNSLTTGTGILYKIANDANYNTLITNAASAPQHAWFGNGRVRFNIQGTAQAFSVEGTGGMNVTQGPISAFGANGNITSQSSVTASGFFGNGSALTGVTGTDSTRVLKAGDTMTGALNLTNAAVNLTGPAGNVVAQASVTASGFFGNGSALTGITHPSSVAASSAPAVNININSVTPVGIATTTITGVGGKSLLVFLSVNVVNSAVSARIFTFRLLKNSVVVLGPATTELASGVAGALNYHYFEASSTAGSQNWTLDIQSNNATGTQTANSPRLTVVESH